LIRTWMAAAVFGFAAFGSAQVDPSKVIATVNGESITGNEYYHRMEFLPGVSMRFGGQMVQSTPGFFTLTQLIGEKLIFQLAKQKSVLPAEQEITDELDARKTANPNYLKESADEGLTENDLRTMVKYDLCKFKLQTYGITVTDQEVKAQYTKHPEQYTTPKQVHTRLIAVRSPADQTAVDKALSSGKTFPEVAKSLSVDVTKSLGGDLGTLPITYFTADAQKAIGGVKIGGTTPWVNIYSLDQDGKTTQNIVAVAKYQLVEALPAKLAPLDKAMTISIRRTLMISKSQGKTDLAKEINDMRTKSKVTITQPTYQELWNSMQNVDPGS